MRPIKQRFILVDSLRGIAATAVMFYHLYGAFSQKAPSSLLDRIPWLADVVLMHGYLGVQVFFVISGFVMAHSLRRYPLDLRNFGVFALRRSIRLDPPYWLAIWCIFAINILGNALFDRTDVDVPGPLGLVANMFYLDNILGAVSVVPVGWTLCLEIQFYLVFFLLLWTARQPRTDERSNPNGGTFSKTRALWIFVPAMALALCWPLDVFKENLYQGLWFPQWFMFLAGVFACWAISDRRAERWLILFLGIIAALAAAYTFWLPANSVVFMGPQGLARGGPVLWAIFFTATLIYVAGKLNRMGSWLNHSLLQHLGRISYSLYLMHIITGLRLMNVLGRFGFDSAWGSVMLLLIGLVGSLVGAHLMYYFVERPCVRLADRLREHFRSQAAAQG